MVTFFGPYICSALGLFGDTPSFIVNNAFLHGERIQVLPIKWWRYIIALIKQSYYEPAGAQCHKTGWKTGSLDFLSFGLAEQYSSPPLTIISAAPIKWLYIHAVTSLFSYKPSAPTLCRFSHLGKLMGGLPAIYLILNITFQWSFILANTNRKNLLHLFTYTFSTINDNMSCIMH